MRTLRFIFMAFLCPMFSIVHAQNQSTIPLQDQIAQAVSQLPTIGRASNILYESVPEYFPYQYADGSGQTDSLYMNSYGYVLTCGMLQHGSTTGTYQGLSIDSASAERNRQEYEEVVRLGALYYEYDKVKQEAVDLGYLQWNGTYFSDASPASYNIYERKELFAFAPLKDEVEGNEVTFLLDEDLFHTNLQWPSVFKMDFGDGNGWQYLFEGESYTASYALGVESQIVRCEIQDAQGNVLESEFRILLDNAIPIATFSENNFAPDTMYRIGGDPRSICDGRNEDLCKADRFEQFRKGRALLPEWGKDTYVEEGVEIFYWGNRYCDTENIQHRKPLIIVDGFDPNQMADYTYLFKQYDDEFKIFSGPGLLNDDYDFTGTVSSYLHDDTYDLYFVNFGVDNNTGPIQNNAVWLEHAIRLINDLKAADGNDEPNVLIGASMGGLISKWCISDMENKGYDHQIEKFISFDSPLRGANIPIGIQAMLKDVDQTKIFGIPIGEMVSKVREGWETLNTPAAKQMLYYNRAAVSNINVSADELRSLSDPFLTQLAAKQIEVPHYMISNGDLSGQTLDFTPGDKVANLDALVLLTGLAIPFNLTMDINIYSSPGISGGKVYDKIFTQWTLGIPFLSSSYFKVNNLLPLDHAAGGTRSFASKDDIFFAFPMLYANTLFEIPVLSFIPAPSALGLDIATNLHQDLRGSINAVQVNYPNVVDFRGSTEPEQSSNHAHNNIEHVTLNYGLAAWFVDHFTNPSFLDPSGDPIASLINETYHIGVNWEESIFNGVRIDNSMTIGQGGNLHIGRNQNIGYIPGSNIPNLGDSVVAYIAADRCDESLNAIVTVDNGGRIRLGHSGIHKGTLVIQEGAELFIKDGGHVQLNNDGNLIIEENSTVRLLSGAWLELNGSSQLIVKEGGQLILEDGAKLDLDHASQLILENNSEVTFPTGLQVALKGQSAILVAGQGNLKVYDGIQWDVQGDSYLQFKGRLTTMEDVSMHFTDGYLWFIGLGNMHHGGSFNLSSVSRSRLLLRLSSSAKLNFGNYSFHMEDGKALLDKNCSISSGVNEYFTFTNVFFEGNYQMISYPKNAYVYAYNNTPVISVNGSNSFTIVDCKFHNVHKGIRITSTGGNQANIEWTEFEDFYVGIEAANTNTLRIQGCYFHNMALFDLSSTTGVWSLWNVGLVDCTNTTFEKLMYGILDDIETNELVIDVSNCTNFRECKFGIYGNVTDVQLDDSYLMNNYVGIGGEVVQLDIQGNSSTEYNGFVWCYDYPITPILPQGLNQSGPVSATGGLNGGSLGQTPPDWEGPPFLDPPFVFPHCTMLFNIENTTSNTDIQAQNNYWLIDPPRIFEDYIIASQTSGYLELNTASSIILGEPPAIDICNGTVEGRFEKESVVHKPSQIEVYPNPVFDQLFIKGAENQDIQIFDHLGRIVFKGTPRLGHIDVRTYPPGMYVVKAGNASYKVIKQ
jgi:hypothetical protein